MTGKTGAERLHSAPRRSRAQDIDRHIGMRIRARRTLLGLTQQQLAELIDVTYQQAHKYERGINRLSAGRLLQVAEALGVEVGFFFEGVEGGPRPQPNDRQRALLELARSFALLPRSHQEAIQRLARALAGLNRSEDDETGGMSGTKR
jgi:transcriptional regulator with XRE-family HTH domain